MENSTNALRYCFFRTCRETLGVTFELALSYSESLLSLPRLTPSHRSQTYSELARATFEGTRWLFCTYITRRAVSVSLIYFDCGHKLSNTSQVSMVYFQVNALNEWIIGIYLHEFTNNERQISIPHEAASYGVENLEFIVSERVLVNPDSSRAMSAFTFLLFKLNTLQQKSSKFESAEAMV